MPTEVQIYKDATISAADLADKTITATQIADKTITATQIADGTITATQLSSAINFFPIGGIVMWSGTVAAISSLTGWALCDGTNGTPDLRERFVVGAGGNNPTVAGTTGYNVNDKAGSADAILVSHSHTGTTGNQNADHTHPHNRFDCCAGSNYDGLHGFRTSGGNYYNATDMPGANTGVQNTNHQHGFTTSVEGSVATNANLPPYYALAFIMKAS